MADRGSDRGKAWAREWAKYWAFRLAAAAVPRIPRAAASRLASGLGYLFWALAPALRARAERNLRHIPGLALDPVRLHRAIRGVFYHSVLNYLDCFRGRALTDEDVLGGWTTEGEEAFDAIMARGRGLVLLTAHVSGFEEGASRLGAKGFGVVTPVERLKPEAFFQLVRRIREHHGLRFIPADSRETVRELIEALRRNEVAVFAVDRYIAGASAAIPFFGEMARMPTGPAALALRLGAPVGVALSRRLAPDRMCASFTPLALAALTAAPPGAAAPGEAEGGPAATKVARPAKAPADAPIRVQRAFLEHLERYLREHPEQWVSALSPVWEA